MSQRPLIRRTMPRRFCLPSSQSKFPQHIPFHLHDYLSRFDTDTVRPCSSCIPLRPKLHYFTSPLRRILLYSILDTDAATRFSLTTDVCNEALDLEGCSVVVAYHPPVSFSWSRSVCFSSVLLRCSVWDRADLRASLISFSIRFLVLDSWVGM
jgi:hypothetical protein